MASYKIVWKLSAKKELRKLSKTMIPRILKTVENLSIQPHPHGCKKLKGAQFIYRIRTGNYRIVYSVENTILLIEIIRVKHRKDVYEKK